MSQYITDDDEGNILDVADAPTDAAGTSDTKATTTGRGNDKKPTLANSEIELYLLGHILADAERLDAVSSDLFAVPEHRAIYTAARELVTDNKPVDVPLLLTQLHKDKQPKAIETVDQIVNGLPTLDADNFDAHLAVAEQMRYKRAVLAAAQHIAAEAMGDCEDIPDLVNKLKAEADNARVENSGLAVGGGSFLFDDDGEDAVAIWGDDTQVAWAAGEGLMFCGGQGIGKTTLGQQLLRARAGFIDELLGMPVKPSASRVLYIAADRPRQARRSMRRMFTKEERELLDERVVIWQGPLPQSLNEKPEILLQMCIENGCDTVIIDSLKDVAFDISKDETGSRVNMAFQFCIAAGVEVLVLHHQRKNGAGGVGKPNSISDIYGSTWVTSGLGSIFYLEGNPGDPVAVMHHLKQPMDEIGPLTIIHDHTAGTSTVEEGVSVLDMCSTHGGTDVQTVARRLYNVTEPTKPQIEKARRKLDKLCASGLVEKREGVSGGSGGSAPSRYIAKGAPKMGTVMPSGPAPWERKSDAGSPF